MATFDEQIKAFQRKALDNIDKTMRGVSQRLFKAIIFDSPIDTGRFRGNWQASGATPKLGQLDLFDKSGNKTVADMTQYIKTAASAEQFTLANNLPYAAKLEFGGYGNGPKTVGGFSEQAPQGMVRVNVATFQRLLDEAARENR